MSRLRREKRRFWGLTAGTVLVALCCFSPILVIAVAAVGLGTIVAYLDVILFPVLFVILGLTYWAYRNYQKECARCNLTSDAKEEHESI